MAVDLPSSQDDLRALLSSAVSSRATHIRQNKETITMANVRRLLENDLGLDKFCLDPHKSIINPLVDEVLLSTENVEEPEKEKVTDGNAAATDEIEEGQSPAKASEKSPENKSREEELSGDVNSKESLEDLSVEAPKKKQKKSRKDKVHSKEKREQDSGDHPEVSEGSDDDIPEVKKPKKVVKTSNVKVAGDKTIEHLRKTIKACGLGIPPSIYKKAKQLDGDKQNNFIIKELEGILNRQGLSPNPTEKEMKAAKRRIAREKDLEGIDMTNIITEPRSRRTASQMFSPVYKPPKRRFVESDSSEEDAKITNGSYSSEDDVKKADNEESAPASAGNDHVECAEPAEKE